MERALLQPLKNPERLSWQRQALRTCDTMRRKLYFFVLPKRSQGFSLLKRANTLRSFASYAPECQGMDEKANSLTDPMDDAMLFVT